MFRIKIYAFKVLESNHKNHDIKSNGLNEHLNVKSIKPTQPK
jgi:hypothetical protein